MPMSVRYKCASCAEPFAVDDEDPFTASAAATAHLDANHTHVLTVEFYWTPAPVPAEP